jgi:hypothetical protein
MIAMSNLTPKRLTGMSPLSALVKFESDPTLAEIVTALDATKVVNRFTTADYVFKNRFDYQLWRILAIPDVRGGVARSWGKPAAIAYQGLKEGGDIQVWGIIQVIAKELTKQARLRTLTLEELTELVAPCYQRLHQGLKFLEGAKAGCAFARINILDALQNHLHDIGAHVTPDQAEEHANAVERYLKEIDPLWELESLSNSRFRRASPSLDSIDEERTTFRRALHRIRSQKRGALGNRRMVSIVRHPETFQNLSCNLFHVRGVIVAALNKLDGQELLDSVSLLRKAAQFARCAWLVARDGRRFSATSSSEVKSELLLCEHRSLWRCSQALIDLGDFLGSAALNARLLWQIPPELALRSERNSSRDERNIPNDFQNIHRKVWKSIHQAGYEGPKWARGMEKNEKGEVVWKGVKQAGDQLTEEPLGTPVEEIPETPSYAVDNTDALPRPTSNSTSNQKCNLNDRCLEQLVRTDARWSAIFSVNRLISAKEATARQARHHLQWIGRKSESLAGRQEVLRSAFSLSLELGLLRNASWILEFLDATPDEILDFAALIRRATQLMPIFLEAKQYDKWQARLAAAFARLPRQEVEAMTERQTFLLHEILTGRCVSLVRGSPEALQQLYQEKFDDKASESTLREALDVKVRPLIWATGTVPIDALEKLGHRTTGVGCSRLENPTLMSLVDLGDDHFNLMFKRPGGMWQKEFIYLNGFNKASKSVLAFRGLWYSPTEKSVPWPEKFQDLAQLLARKLKLSESEPNWLIASVSASLAVFPLRDLVLRHISPQTVLSLVPNFTWASGEYHKFPLRRPSIFKLGPDPLYQGVKEIIEQRKSSLEGAAVALGHGEWSDGVFNSITAESGALTADEWLELTKRRVCVVHSCWGGRADERLLGDLGGLPWKAFASGCRLFCAPVCEVSPETAVALHRHLTGADGPSEIGLRYLNAIREDPAVSLYALYGFADEPAKMS